MGKVVLIVNFYGGVPACLHPTIVHDGRTEGWTSFATFQTIHSHNRPDAAFRHSYCNVFRTLRDGGFETILLGSHPLECSERVLSSDTLPDPRARFLAEWGVARCSLYEHPVQGCYTTTVHDDEVFREAMEILGDRRDHGDRGDRGDLALCINLKSFDDVLHMALASDGSTAVRTCLQVSPPASCDDERLVSRALNSLHVTDGDHRRVTPQEYTAAITYCLDRWNHVKERLRILLDTRKCDQVAFTSTASMALGEHGHYGTDGPYAQTCNAFWCSTLDCNVHPCQYVSTRVLLDTFAEGVLADTSVMAVQDRIRKLSSPPTTLCERGWLRIIVQYRGRVYSCVVRDGDIVLLFDATSDPHEVDDLKPSMAHILSDLTPLLSLPMKPSRNEGQPSENQRPSSSSLPTRRRPSPIVSTIVGQSPSTTSPTAGQSSKTQASNVASRERLAFMTLR